MDDTDIFEMDFVVKYPFSDFTFSVKKEKIGEEFMLVGICKEFEITIQGKDINELQKRVDEAIIGHVQVCGQLKKVPFESIRRKKIPEKK